MASVGLLFVAESLRDAIGTSSYPTLSDLRSRLLPACDGFCPCWRRLRCRRVCSRVLACGTTWRFGRAFEFGHSYLQTMQADNIQRFGLMNYQYLPRNLATALTLLPKLLPSYPYVQVSYHGLALWFTSPALLFLLWRSAAVVERTPHLQLSTEASGCAGCVSCFC